MASVFSGSLLLTQPLWEVTTSERFSFLACILLYRFHKKGNWKTKRPVFINLPSIGCDCSPEKPRFWLTWWGLMVNRYHKLFLLALQSVSPFKFKLCSRSLQDAASWNGSSGSLAGCLSLLTLFPSAVAGTPLQVFFQDFSPPPDSSPNRCPCYCQHSKRRILSRCCSSCVSGQEVLSCLASFLSDRVFFFLLRNITCLMEEGDLQDVYQGLGLNRKSLASVASEVSFQEICRDMKGKSSFVLDRRRASMGQE